MKWKSAIKRRSQLAQRSVHAQGRSSERTASQTVGRRSRHRVVVSIAATTLYTTDE